MPTFKINKKEFDVLINNLIKKVEVIAPVKDDEIMFKNISNASDIDLSFVSYFPAKEFFFKKYETLLAFKKDKITVPKNKIKKRIFFGLRRCDLNSIMHQDIAFLRGKFKDPYYENKRKNVMLFGFHCWKAFEYCFCGSLNLKDFYDLMFYDFKDHFLVETGSKKGEEFVKEHKKVFKKSKKEITEKEKVIKNANRLKKKDISKYYEHKDWQKGVDLCLSCASCNHLCPSCYCFNIHNDVSISDLSEGRKYRIWSACQLRDFTRVAGDHVFRDKRTDRFKHRIYHQLEYFKELHNVNLCTGCGRCIRGCPTRIDFVKIINDMK